MEETQNLATEAEGYAYGLAWADSEITECWVGIRRIPEQDGTGGTYSVRVDVKVPGHDLVAKRVPHDDVHLAMRYAFQDMENQLHGIDARTNHSEYAATINGQLMTQDEIAKELSDRQRRIRDEK